MTEIRITIPDAIVADVVAAVKGHYGSDVAAFTNKQLLAYHLRQTVGPIYAAHKKRTAAAIQAARTEREAHDALRASAMAADERAVRDAEAATKAQAATDIGGVA